MSSSAARAVPVAHGRETRRVRGATDWWFYPLVLAIALALTLGSLGADAIGGDPAPQRATRDGATLVYGPQNLAAGLAVDGAQVAYVPRELGVAAKAVRLAVKPGAPDLSPDYAGARLLLDPADTAGLAGREVEVTLQYRRFNVTAAAAVAVSLQSGEPVNWVVAPLPPEGGTVRVRVPAPPGGPPAALGLRMLTDRTDLNYGAEIGRIALAPAG